MLELVVKLTDVQTYGIQQLAELAGISVRAIRYYISLGVLPPPDEKGPSARYGKIHLERLQLIDQLKARRLSLSEINQTLSTLTSEQITRLIDSTTPPYLESDEGFGGSVSMDPPLAVMAASPQSAPGRPVDLSIADAAPPPAGQDETESWVRQKISDEVEIHYRTPLSGDAEEKVLSLISRARAMFRNPEKSDGPRTGRSRFFHRRQNRNK